jgi:uncharacterized protein YyaL (SSP411 family)
MYKPLIVVVTYGLLLFSLQAPAHALSNPLSNQLRNHPSPYLAMHGNDPVAWQAWDESVLKRAQTENKLIFVSIGYFSCHWCHVMQRESYQDPTIAKRLNEHFIPVKVDRELDPALDAYLIDFVQNTRGYAGWPLNVFLTPQGHPVVGMVYVPEDQFRSLLMQLSELWAENKDSLSQTAAQAAAVRQAQLSTDQAGFEAKIAPDASKTLHTLLLGQILQAADDIQGGFGDQAKFPMVAQLEFLISVYQQHPSDQVGHFVQLTLEHMASQGLRDHIGGGFFRYTVDPDWQTPHFEKMLYDNAQLARLYLMAAKVFGRQDFEAIATDTLDFMLREMGTDKGGMVASLSAVDSDNVEGGYYLWRKDELQKQLSAQEYEIVSLVWNLERPSHFDAGYLPVQAVSPDQVAKKLGKEINTVMNVMASVRAKLYAARQSRTVPVDDKQLTAWNALALSTLVEASQLREGETYLRAAQKIRNFLVNRMWDGKRLARAKNAGEAIAAAGLEDYAYAAQALLQWSLLDKSANSRDDRQLAKHWINLAWERFYTATGWRLSDQLSLPGVFGSIAYEDNPMPSPSAVVIKTSLQLADLNDDKQLRQRAINALAISQGLLENQPFAYASQIGLFAQLNQ